MLQDAETVGTDVGRLCGLPKHRTENLRGRGEAQGGVWGVEEEGGGGHP